MESKTWKESIKKAGVVFLFVIIFISLTIIPALYIINKTDNIFLSLGYILVVTFIIFILVIKFGLFDDK